jgi:predicted RNase H-like nuclease (RuvC/YqgF family)
MRDAEKTIETLKAENSILKDKITSLEKKIKILERGCACYRNNLKWSQK